MPYKDSNKRREYNRKWMKSNRSKKEENVEPVEPSTSSSEKEENVEPVEPSTSSSKKPDRFTTHHQQYIDKLKRIEESNNNRLREMNGSLLWQITVSDGVTYVPSTKYMSSSYL